MISTQSQHPAAWLCYLRLFRAPNVFTAMADVAMGYFVTTQSLVRWVDLLLLLAASSLLYTAGMVLNDVFDYDVDLRERPQRPLPAGQIPLRWAKWLGWEMLAVGVAVAWLAGWSSGSADAWWRPGLVATSLAGCIVLYNGGAKRFWLGPGVMGSCRFLNVLLGMSLTAAASGTGSGWLGYETSHLMIAGGIGVYIVGVTIFARSETTRSPRGLLVLGVVVMVAGIALLAAFPALHPTAFRYRMDPGSLWPLATLVMSIWILRRCLFAIARPEPARVQAAIKFCILSLIVLDATVCLVVCPTPYALTVLSLLAPTTILGRWIYST